MTLRNIIGPDCTAAGTYLHECVGTEAGRMTVIYILTRLGLFEKTDTEAQAIARNAALDLLNDIRTQTGFVLDIDLIH